MARIEGKEVQERFTQVFGLDGARDIDPAMVLFMVKIIKHCRRYCRSNAALHNWLRRAFPDLQITTTKVPCLPKYAKFEGETYDALKVFNTKQAAGVPKVEEDDDGE